MNKKEIIVRLPLAILTAIGMISLVSDLLMLTTYLNDWISVWRALTRVIWDFLLGWLNVELPTFFIDYLTMSIIIFGIETKAMPNHFGFYFPEPPKTLLKSLFWPYLFIGHLLNSRPCLTDYSVNKQHDRRIIDG